MIYLLGTLVSRSSFREWAQSKSFRVVAKFSAKHRACPGRRDVTEGLIKEGPYLFAHNATKYRCSPREGKLSEEGSS